MSVAAPEVTGITLAGMNGIGFGNNFGIEKVSERYTGISLGILNYTQELKGVQVGLLNYAANNPKWARLLPIVNMHL